MGAYLEAAAMGDELRAAEAALGRLCECLDERTEDGSITRVASVCLRQRIEAVRQALREGPADDGQAVTDAWLAGLPGRVIDPTSTDSTLLQIDGNTYLVVEADRSVAIQQGLYHERDSQYVPLPIVARTRGDVRRLRVGLGANLAEAAPGVG